MIRTPFTITESDSSCPRVVTGEVRIINNTLSIHFDGYGTMTDSDGDTVYFDIDNGQLRVYLWTDINYEDPVLFSLEGAREDRREE